MRFDIFNYNCVATQWQ